MYNEYLRYLVLLERVLSEQYAKTKICQDMNP